MKEREKERDRDKDRDRSRKDRDGHRRDRSKRSRYKNADIYNSDQLISQLFKHKTGKAGVFLKQKLFTSLTPVIFLSIKNHCFKIKLNY